MGGGRRKKNTLTRAIVTRYSHLSLSLFLGVLFTHPLLFPPLPHSFFYHYTHIQIQTETYLEVLTDRAPEEEIGVQTEARMDVPTAPLFVPAPVSFLSFYVT